MTQTVSLPLWALYLQAFLGPVATLAAAGAAAWVTYRIQGGQLKTARDKLKLDLFERRLEYFYVIRNFMRSISASGDMDYEQLSIFDRGLIGFEFLFEAETSEFAEELRSTAFKIRELNDELTELPAGEQRTTKVRELRRVKTKFSELRAQLDQRFLPYFDFRHVRG